MNNSKKLLGIAVYTLQSHQRLIRTLSNAVVRINIRNSLRMILQELDTMEFQAYSVASSRGWELQEKSPVLMCFQKLSYNARLIFLKQDSQIAEIIIRNQTAGMITVSRARSITPHCDGDVISLCQKLLDCQEASIRQMQQFL